MCLLHGHRMASVHYLHSSKDRIVNNTFLSESVFQLLTPTSDNERLRILYVLPNSPSNPSTSQLVAWPIYLHESLRRAFLLGCIAVPNKSSSANKEEGEH